jgi:hypothetical protein
MDVASIERAPASFGAVRHSRGALADSNGGGLKGEHFFLLRALT